MATPRPAIPITFDELDVVRLLATVYDVDTAFPAGTVGTVVFRHPRDEAYEIEVAEPIAAVLTLRATDLEAAE